MDWNVNLSGKGADPDKLEAAFRQFCQEVDRTSEGGEVTGLLSGRETGGQHRSLNIGAPEAIGRTTGATEKASAT